MTMIMMDTAGRYSIVDSDTHSPVGGGDVGRMIDCFQGAGGRAGGLSSTSPVLRPPTPISNPLINDSPVKIPITAQSLPLN